MQDLNKYYEEHPEQKPPYFMPPVYPGSYLPNDYFKCPDETPKPEYSPTTPPTKTPKIETKDMPLCSIQPKNITPKPSKNTHKQFTYNNRFTYKDTV